jgi:glycosyltransferase involved in cell wall biosynthesis
MASVGNLELQTRARSIVAAPRAPSLPRVLYALQLNPGHKSGSLEEQMLTLAARFRAEGGLFLPLFLSNAPDDCLDFYRHRDTPAECLDLSRVRPGTMQRLLALLRTHQIDIVHWNFTAPLSNSYVWWLTLLHPGLRHFFTDHISRSAPMASPPGRVKRWLKRLLLRRYGRTVCVSEFVHECLRRQQVLDESRLATCRFFVNTDRFRPDAVVRERLRRELGASNRFVVLVVAHLIRVKGIDTLIRAMAEVRADAVLWVVGDGANRAEFEALAAERGLIGRVRFLGHQFDVCPYMQAADCFVCPSIWAEAAGLVNIEAAGCGLPVVASRIGGISEHVDDGETGFLFAPGDTAALAERLRQLMADHTLNRRLGTQARAMVIERFSTEARLPDILDVYRR